MYTIEEENYVRTEKYQRVRNFYAIEINMSYVFTVHLKEFYQCYGKPNKKNQTYTIQRNDNMNFFFDRVLSIRQFFFY